MSGIIFVTNGNGKGVVYVRQGDDAIIPYNCLEYLLEKLSLVDIYEEKAANSNDAADGNRRVAPESAMQRGVDHDGPVSPKGNSISVANTPGSLWRLTEPPYLATMPSTLRIPNPWSWPSFVVA